MGKPTAAQPRTTPRRGQPFDTDAWPEMETFRTRLVGIREARGLTQRELCAVAGLSQSFYSGLELGRRNPTIQLVAVLARHLGVPMTLLLHNKIEKPECGPDENVFEFEELTAAQLDRLTKRPTDERS